MGTSMDEPNGSVLIGALVILLMLMLVFVAVLTFGVARFGEARKTKNRVVARYAAETGVTRFVKSLNLGNTNQGDTLRDSLENGAVFVATIRPWGGYLLVRSIGTFANQHVTALAQIGSRPPEELKAALSVGDQRYPLVLSRGTCIVGDVNAGPLGVATGAISGIGVALDSALRGQVHARAELTVPRANEACIAWESLADGRRNSSQHFLAGAQTFDSQRLGQLEHQQDVFVDGSLVISGRWRSEWEEVPQVFASGVIDVRGEAMLSGFAVLVSQSYIRVGDFACLDGVMLMANDSIVFQDHSHFAGLAVTPGRIVLRDQTQSRFPAAFVSFPVTGISHAARGIDLATDGTVEGVCFAMADATDIAEEASYLRCSFGVNFRGELISQGYADVSGTVDGSVWVQTMRFVEPPTTYVNWTRNLTINRARLRYAMPLPVLVSSESPLTIVRMETQK